MAKKIAGYREKNISTDNIFLLFLFNFDIPDNIHVMQMSDHEVINDRQLEALCGIDSEGQDKHTLYQRHYIEMLKSVIENYDAHYPHLCNKTICLDSSPSVEQYGGAYQ